MHSRTQLHTRPAPVLHGFYVHDAASAPRPRLRVALRQATQSSRPSAKAFCAVQLLVQPACSDLIKSS
ncbi:hypothetical protein CF335_g9543 [Tilletia laevis]|nr:hypothetical protein CF335_g9543 [Tilletia laevis]